MRQAQSHLQDVQVDLLDVSRRPLHHEFIQTMPVVRDLAALLQTMRCDLLWGL